TCCGIVCVASVAYSATIRRIGGRCVCLGEAVQKQEVCDMAVTIRRDLGGVKIFRVAFIALTLLTASIYPVSAQNLSTATIDGLVTDQSGGALPGVTV